MSLKPIAIFVNALALICDECLLWISDCIANFFLEMQQHNILHPS